MLFKCETCKNDFYTQWARVNHMNDEDHWPRCDTCGETFQTLPACKQHMSDLGHWPRCEICKCLFWTWSFCEDHIIDWGHWSPTVPCETCDERFHTQTLAEQHMRTLGHYGNYCKHCGRFFDNENNLRKHFESRTQRGSNMAWRHSQIDKTTTSGSIRHFETGSSTGATRINRQMTQRVASYLDAQRPPTHHSNWRDGENRQDLATDKTWNGFGWECYVCHKEFARRTGLGNHLNSQAHRQRIYHCSNEKCAKEFSSLDGLFNHLENDACSIARFC
ncbi:hypothetical protein BJY00DRAFT_319848 [Aspergillus carlsbadensis]|nr:hypothetical protein BJY00DRAFT_319848 [Aspergillus carlsbadensis]